MGVFGFVMAGGGSVGVLAGGVLTDLLSWHWVFLVNLPIGIAVLAVGLRLLPAVHTGAERTRLDVPGAIAITGALVLAVLAIVNGHDWGWGTGKTLGLLGAGIALGIAFIAWEARVTAPLMPLGIFRHRNLTVANIVGILWAASMFALFFLSALYLQLVLGYSPLQVGLAYLPGNLLMMVCSLGVSAKLVMRYGFRVPLVFGLPAAAVALLWLARAPVHGSFLVDILPSMILFGIGAGLAFNPVLMAAMSDVEPQNAGLASGITNTAFMMGGAVGLAVLASVAAARTEHLTAAGHGTLEALTGGYHVAFVIGAIFAVGAAAIGGTLLRDRKPDAAAEAPHAEAALEVA
jgi:MFS family permease